MRIRPVTPVDAEALAGILIASWREAYRGFVPVRHLQDLNQEQRAEGFRNAISNHREETYCAEESDGLLGFLTLGPCRDTDLDPATTGEVWGIYLAPEYWRKGVGTMLCRYAEKSLASRHYHQAVLWVFEANGQARRFYEAMGFQSDTATKELTVGGIQLTAMRYRKTLSDTKATAWD